MLLLDKGGRLPIAMMGCLLWCACGGGGGGGSQALATATRAISSPTVPAATATPPVPTHTATVGLLPATATPPPTVPPPSPTAEPTQAGTPTLTPDPSSFTPTPTEMVCPVTTTPEATATPVSTATNTPLIGPEVTALGVADATGALINPAGTEGGLTVYQVQFGSGFVLFVEGRPGITGLAVGSLTTNRSPFDPTVRPDLQIQVDRNLGNGSLATCDNSAPTLGGIPAVVPPDFAVTQRISDALNDLSCRFATFDESQFPCTQDGDGNFAFSDTNTTRQFCVLISNAIAFQSGDTMVTARLRDNGGNAGPATSIVVRVAL